MDMTRLHECPVCGDEAEAREIIRFGSCLDCFADEITQRADDEILFEFLRDHGREFREFIDDRYEGGA